MVMPSPGRARGFTLIELMVVVAIMAIGASIAVPSVSKLVANVRQKGTSAEIFSALIRTRSEAIRLNTSVVITPVTAGRWESGWSIALDGSSEKLDVHSAIVNSSITGPNSLTYLSNGRIQGTSAVTFAVTTTNASGERCVSVDRSGRPYQKSTAC